MAQTTDSSDRRPPKWVEQRIDCFQRALLGQHSSWRNAKITGHFTAPLRVQQPRVCFVWRKFQSNSFANMLRILAMELLNEYMREIARKTAKLVGDVEQRAFVAG